MQSFPVIGHLSLILIAASATQLRSAQAEQFVFRHENVLGTSFELAVECETALAAKQVESRALFELDRLEAILSSYREQSELQRWVRGELDAPMSSELQQVLRAAETWRLRTGGAFDVRSEALRDLYDRRGPVTTSARRALVAQMTRPPYRFGASVEKLDNLPLTVNALAKGFILDRICEVVLSDPKQCVGCLVNIGGDLRISGRFSAEITVTDPHRSSETDRPLATFFMDKPNAVATSGNYRRTVGPLKFHHIFDPRTGLPIRTTASVTVIGKSAMEADAAATAMSVLGLEESLHIAEADELPCLIVTNQGQIHCSSNWPYPITEPEKLVSNIDDSTEEPKGGLTVEFTLSANKQGGRYRRPYVAIWLEDEEGFPVRTGLLWLQSTGRGPRWHRDLTRWFRNDRIRKLSEDIDLIKTMSGATRGPGEYSVRFDGLDNSGQPLKPGNYMLCIEVAREHGTYQLIRDKFIWGNEDIAKKELKPNAEVSSASYSFSPSGKVQ